MITLQGQNPDGAPEGDFMSEAKDWAGELISGQTGTGRILVGFLHIYYSAAECCKILSRNIRDHLPAGRLDRNKSVYENFILSGHRTSNSAKYQLQ